ncbi:MAG TPA: 6,7-dimethyl-8-ribityllumazine synthase [Actinomycetota bacterium]|nr:6,7-dimethyl-8-ribityllumazine synthase [Actinomycetota bacterium]
MRTYEGSFEGRGLRVAIVASRFNETIVKSLVDGAVDCLRRHGVADDDVSLTWVPGAFEIPVAARRLAASGEVHAVVCLGVVIKGQTPHFDFVAGGAAQGIAATAQETGVPVTFGVLTTDTAEQAADRAGGKMGNKGFDAALAAIEMASLLQALPKPPQGL